MLFKDDKYDAPEMRKRVQIDGWLGFAGLAVFVAGLVLITSEMDYQDQKALERENCAMVEEGAYPAAAFPYCEEKGDE